MKTIPVSFLVAGMLLPLACLGQSQDSPRGPSKDPMGGRRGPERPTVEAWKVADLDGDGQISMAELGSMSRIQNLTEEKRKSLFNRLDKNADGKLSREELGRFGKPRDGEPDRPMLRLWELDADKSGGVSFEEFKKGSLFMKLPVEKQLAVFKRLDSDGDQVITPMDRPEPAPKGPDGKSRPNRPDGKHPRKGEERNEPADPVNGRLDLDGDGTLSFAEFRAGPTVKDLTEDEQEDQFERFDRNGDLKISPLDALPPPPPIHESSHPE